MAQITTVSVNDRKSTPVAHVFKVDSVKDGVASLMNVAANGGILAGAERLQLTMRKTPLRARGKVSLSLPVVQTETINGISNPVVVRTGYGNAEFVHDIRATPQERSDLVGMLANLLATTQTQVIATIVDCETPFG